MRRGLLGRVIELNTAASLGRPPEELAAATAEAEQVLRGRIMRKMERKEERLAAQARIAETLAEQDRVRLLETDRLRREAGLPTYAEVETQRILEDMEGLLSDDDDDLREPISPSGCFATLRGCFGRNKGTRRNQSTREDSRAFADGRGTRRIARRRRSKARHSRRRTRSAARRSKARHNRRRTRSKARRSKARHSRRRTRSKARRSKAPRKRKGGRGTRKRN